MTEASLSLAPATTPRRLGRSIGAVLAGLATIFVTHSGTDAVLHATHVFPEMGVPMSDALFALAIAYRSVFSVLGGYVTARLSPNKPRLHALWLGSIGVAICTVALIATWNANLGPRWYTMALALSAIPCALLGARLHRR
jgi:hypothetical protein